MLGALVMLVITTPSSPRCGARRAAGVAPILLFGRRVRKLSRASRTHRRRDTHIDESLHEIRTVQSYGTRTRTASSSARRRAGLCDRGKRIGQRALLVALVMLLAFGASRDPVDRRPRRPRRADLRASSRFRVLRVLVAGRRPVSEMIGDLQRRGRDRAADGAARKRILDPRPANPQPLPEPSRGEVASNASPSAILRARTPPRSRIFPFRCRAREAGVVGPSGAGKSTVFTAVALLRSRLGRITLTGSSSRTLTRAAVRSRIALCRRTR